MSSALKKSVSAHTSHLHTAVFSLSYQCWPRLSPFYLFHLLTFTLYISPCGSGAGGTNVNACDGGGGGGGGSGGGGGGGGGVYMWPDVGVGTD